MAARAYPPGPTLVDCGEPDCTVQHHVWADVDLSEQSGVLVQRACVAAGVAGTETDLVEGIEVGNDDFPNLRLHGSSRRVQRDYTN